MLRFRLFDIPVVVRPSFLLIAAIIGFSWASQPSRALIWIGVIFVSILIHELGHALTARGFGSEVAIELNAVGGLTSWSIPAEDFGPGRRAVVAAAGSAVGVLFGSLVWLVNLWLGPFSGAANVLVSTLIFVNVFWGLLNWLPLRPLDGGHLLISLLQKLSPRRAETIARVIFFATAAIALALSLYFRLYIIAALMGWMLWIEIAPARPQPAPVPIPDLSFDEVESGELGAGELGAGESEAGEPATAEPERDEIEPNVDGSGG